VEIGKYHVDRAKYAGMTFTDNNFIGEIGTLSNHIR
jgi:hypothetical protein